MTRLNKNSASKKTYYEKGGRNDIISTDKLNRALVGMTFDNDDTNTISYNPLPKTQDEIITVCGYSLDSNVRFERTLTQIEKSVMDAIYTLWYRDQIKEKYADVECDHWYSLTQIARIVRGANDDARFSREYLSMISDALEKVSFMKVEIDCREEMEARFFANKITKDECKRMKYIYSAWVQLLPCKLYERRNADNPDDRILIGVEVTEEPPLYSYSLLSEGYEKVSVKKFQFPEGMALTRQRIILRNYLRERIMMINRAEISNIVSYSTLFPIALGKKEDDCSYTEKSRLLKDMKAILSQFAKDGVLDEDKPYQPIMKKTKRHDKESGIKLFLS